MLFTFLFFPYFCVIQFSVPHLVPLGRNKVLNMEKISSLELGLFQPWLTFGTFHTRLLVEIMQGPLYVFMRSREYPGSQPNFFMMAHFHHLAFKFYHNRKLMSLRSNGLIIYCFFAGIFKVALNHKKLGISKEILATRVLPFLFPLSIENSLTPTQHSAIMVLIKVSEK